MEDKSRIIASNQVRDVLKVRYRMTCRTTTNFIHMFNYDNKKKII